MKHVLTPGAFIFFIIVLGNLLLFLLHVRSITMIYVGGEKTKGVLKEAAYNEYYQKMIYDVEFYHDSTKYTATNRSFLSAGFKIGDTLHVAFEKGNPKNSILLADWLWTAVLIHLVITVFITFAFLSFVKYMYKYSN